MKMDWRVMPALLTYSISPRSSILRLTELAIMTPNRPWMTPMNTSISWLNMMAIV